jgi:hypothetical protein
VRNQHHPNSSAINSVLGEIKIVDYNLLYCNGYVQRMDEERLPRNVLNWYLLEEGKEGDMERRRA